MIDVYPRPRMVDLDTNNANGDAFGRLRVSETQTLFDSKQIFDNQPLFWDDQEVSGSGTGSVHSVPRASTTLSVSASTAGKRVRQTFMSFNYQPGKSQLILCTGILDKAGGGAGITRGFGSFNDDNGIFLYDDEGTIKAVQRSNATGTPVDTEVAQSSWNIDPFDGSGPSGLTADWTKTQILVIDFEWLGVGRVRLGLNIDGQTRYMHEFRNANSLDVVYMSTPNLPIRYEIANDGTGVASSLENICTSVLTEGGMEELGFVRSIGTNGSPITATSVGTTYAIGGLRLKTASIGAVVKLISTDIQVQTGAGQGYFTLVLNPTVAGTFTYGDIADSRLQVAGGASANTVTGGTVLNQGFGSSDSGGVRAPIITSRYLGAAIDGTRDEVVLCWTPTVGANQEIEGALVWREL